MNLFMSIFLLLAFVAVIAIVAFVIILIARSGQKSRQEYAQYQQANGNGMPNNTPPFAQDAPSLGYAVLGFFIPLVGLILFLTWQSSFPFRARSAGKGALISVICNVVIGVVLTVVWLLAAMYI